MSTIVNDRYTIRMRVPGSPAETDQSVRAALAAEGFGILTEIDVQATLRAKLGEEIGAYTILGACAPPLAHQGIEADPALGALLPCNVVVRAHPDGGSEVIAVDAHAMLGLADVDELSAVAGEVAGRLQRALEAVSA
ncbi:MAG TPA: DUF302 domain-containing protein [Nitriliruptoraceae bacterium]|nr:DUF302 domain-containing protein [Nitriliruptoraceae bacterium]